MSDQPGSTTVWADDEVANNAWAATTVQPVISDAHRPREADPDRFLS